MAKLNKCFLVLYLAATATSAVSAFSFQAQSPGLVSLDESIPRDMCVYPMVDWATSCGVQISPGFQLVPTGQQQDYCAMTQEDLPAGSPVLFVPNEMVLSDDNALEEFQYGELAEAETQLSNANLGDKIRLFRLFIKILVEYERGEQSPWYPWLNSLPRLYNTGASMTYACFDCLPVYAAWLALTERKTFVNFQKAVEFVPSLNKDIVGNVEVLKWAYNVAITRCIRWKGQRLIAPMADMFNHAADPEVEVNYDEQGNCVAFTCKDVPAGSPLRMCYTDDPTNPSPLLATYGFLDETSPAVFCKTMHLRPEMEELGYDFSNLLFYKDTGEISMEVYDVQLYAILKKNDPNLAQEFYQAVMNDKRNSGGEGSKMQYHQQYFQFTKEELQKHVDTTLRNLDKMSNKASSYSIETHPRAPIILQHNAFVKDTFLRVKQNLDNM